MSTITRVPFARHLRSGRPQRDLPGPRNTPDRPLRDHAARRTARGAGVVRLITATGTGATGWCASAALERHSAQPLPSPVERRLAWFVRKAWPSPITGTTLTEGSLADTLTVTVSSDRLVAFGDGIETDALTLSWGQSAQLSIAERVLNLVH